MRLRLSDETCTHPVFLEIPLFRQAFPLFNFTLLSGSLQEFSEASEGRSFCGVIVKSAGHLITLSNTLPTFAAK
jgi:hypothetical protein